jgi:hypothetical protein
MDLTEGSETSAKHNLTPGKYPKEHIQFLYLLVFHTYINEMQGSRSKISSIKSRQAALGGGI